MKVISEEALKVSQDKTVSVIIEDLLQLANRNQLWAILDNFAYDWELACCDRSASFVTQSLLLRLNKFLGKKNSLLHLPYGNCNQTFIKSHSLIQKCPRPKSVTK